MGKECPLCKTKLQMDKVEASTALAKLFAEVLNEYEEAEKLIMHHNDAPLMADLELKDKLSVYRAKFNSTHKNLITTSNKSENKIIVPIEVLRKLIDFTEKKSEVEDEEDLGFIAAQNAVREILSEIKV